MESEVALVVRFGDADILFQTWVGWRQCEPIAQFPVDHLLGVGSDWQECDWGALSWIIFPLVRADQLTGYRCCPWPGIGSELSFVEGHLTWRAVEGGVDT
jgi:hypothetical protein